MARRAPAPDEGDAAPQFVSRFAAHVEPQVDLFEVAVERNRHAAHLRAQEEKTYDADEVVAPEVVELGCRAEPARAAWRDRPGS